MSEEARQQAQVEKLTLVVAENATGYFGVYLANPGRPKAYQAQVWRGGKKANLGCFATAEEAALCVARSPEGQVLAAARAAAAAPLTSEEARQQARAEGLTLLVGENKTGYYGVAHGPSRISKPYQAYVWRGGKKVSLGCFATAEEAALFVARSPEGQVAAGRAAGRAASAESRGALPAVPSGAIPREKGTATAMAPGAVVGVEALLLLLENDDNLGLEECIGRQGGDDDLRVKEEEGSEDVRPKRQRIK